jgi:hypothetical protein
VNTEIVSVLAILSTDYHDANIGPRHIHDQRVQIYHTLDEEYGLGGYILTELCAFDPVTGLSRFSNLGRLVAHIMFQSMDVVAVCKDVMTCSVDQIRFIEELFATHGTRLLLMDSVDVREELFPTPADCNGGPISKPFSDLDEDDPLLQPD